MTTDVPVQIAVMPPVPVERCRRVVLEPSGDWTIADVVEATGLDPSSVGASLNGRIIPREEWEATIPQPGDSVIVTERPGVFAFFLALYAGAGATIATASTAAIIAAAVSTIAVSFGVSMLASSLLAPKANSVDAVAPGSRRTIAGDSNSFRAYDTVPQVLGRHRLYPPLAARGYTTVEDGKLYQYALFTFGYGQLALSDFRIADEPMFRSTTSISYTGSMLADTDHFAIQRNASGVVTRSSVELEIRAGTNTDAAITLFASDIQEEVIGKRLRYNAGWHVRRTIDGVTRITVIVSCPGGLIWRTDSGKVKDRKVRVAVAYRAAGSDGAWTDVTERKKRTEDVIQNGRVTKKTVWYDAPIEMEAQTVSSVHVSRTWEVAEGTYDVRLERRSEEGEDPGIIDATEWTSMLCNRSGPVVTETGLCLVAAKIQITGRFNGLVNQFNAVAQTVIPDWTGSAWTTRATSNPASLFRHVLQGRANKRAVADGRINLTALAAWADECTTKSFGCNFVTQGRATVADVLRTVATCGRASPGVRDGLFSVVRENSLTGAPVAHFTPRNIKSFVETRRFVSIPNALKVQFVDPDSGWLDTERIVPDDGYTATTATTFERLDVAGITSSDQAYKIGRYHLAVMRLRPSEYVIETDFEHLDCVRGDLVRLSHDAILVGLAWGRVVSISTNGSGACTSIVVDQECPMAAATYAVRVRKSNGSSVERTVTTVAGNQTTLTYATPIPSGDPQPEAGDLFMFGESGEESLRLIVREIESIGDLGARLTLVDANAGILTADTGTIPAYDPQITIPPQVNAASLSSPRVLDVSTTRIRDRDPVDPSPSYGVRITVQPSGTRTT